MHTSMYVNLYVYAHIHVTENMFNKAFELQLNRAFACS